MITNSPDGANSEERGIFLLARKVGNGLERMIELPVFILSILMTAIVLLGVFFRYVVRDPLGWSEELSRYLMIWMALLSVALCVWRHEHVGVTMAIKKLPRTVAKTLIFVSNGLVMYFLLVLTRYGFRMAEGGKAQLSTALDTSMEWWLMAVPVSALLCMIMLSCKMVLDVRRKNIDEMLMSEDIIDTVKREEGLDFGDVPLKEAKPR
ncbi:TRAP transporter small permease [Aminivibrio sp.]|jgi:TRAP-type C4-dicarboxylate transport system permease small subunit|uniref:TRAP transporter small permease n=1 Tax=Aminivibrio sp. TaxID=1872489 RepID=UPI001A39C55C|nr:TRAP transporter small permease [Aminivibrio sp.]MBL3540065.1 TRAP transporter small permease [Aminivibrio sp.]MDK2957966.1 TRAP-type transport system small permease protein [Synergistaceae bacterium]